MSEERDVQERGIRTAPLARFARFFPEGLKAAESRLIRERRKQALGTSAADSVPEAEELARRAGSTDDDRVGIALSGGGIRSATFCLGVFQGLAEKGLLRQVDYLSTVSGGGYFGGFFGRLCGRNWLRSTDTDEMPPEDEHLASEPNPMRRVEALLAQEDSWPMRYLRDCGRYINPNSSGDWGLALAMVLRNWIATLLVLWTLAFAVFLFGILTRSLFWSVTSLGWFGEGWLATRPVAGVWWSRWVVLPVGLFTLVSLPAGIAYWLTQAPWWSAFGLDYKRLRMEYFGPALIVLMSIGLMVLGPRHQFLDDQPWIPYLAALQMVLAALFLERARAKTARGDRRYGPRNVLARDLSRSLAACLALLGLVAIDSFGQSLFAGRQHTGAMGESVSFLSLLGGFLGLAAIAASGERIAQMMQRIPLFKNARAMAALTAIVVSGVLWGGFLLSAAYWAHSTAWDGREPGIEMVALQGDSLVLAPGALLRPADSTVADSSSTSGPDSVAGSTPAAVDAAIVGPGMALPGAVPWKTFVDRSGRDPDLSVTPHRMQTGVSFLIAAVLSLLFGYTYAFFNMSSLHSFYRARLSRAYLGASNEHRFGESKTNVGTPIQGDDVTWAGYRPWRNGGPLHIVNQTLNQTVGGTRQIESRDRRGQILAVGPSGLSVGVQNHARWGNLPAARAAAAQRATFDRKAAKKEAPYLRRAFRPITPLEVEARRFHAFGVPPVGPEALDRGHRYPEGAVTKVEKRTLGRNIAISGAAFSTGVGFRTRPWFTLLAAIFNVRMGYWWSVRPPRQRFEGTGHGPEEIGPLERMFEALLPVQTRLISEALGLFRGPYIDRWYVSDGGHFENLGLYELIRRRVPFVIACDCGQDADYGFNDLAVLTRHLRLDFQAELEVLDQDELTRLNVHPEIATLLRTPESFLPTPAGGEKSKGPRRADGHGLLARVRYRAEDGEPEPNPTYVLFIKPSVLGDEPEDVLHYQRVNADFPHQPTVDQDYDEAQWESYRKLGRAIATKLFVDVPASGAWRPYDMRAP